MLTVGAERRADPCRRPARRWASCCAATGTPIAFEQDFDARPGQDGPAAGRGLDALQDAVRPVRHHPRGLPAPPGVAGLRRRATSDGIRCGYHGWKFDFDGQCVEQPAERGRTPTSATRCGPGRPGAGDGRDGVGLRRSRSPAPELPRFDVFVMDGVRDIGCADLPCNCLQIMENSVDPHHVEWLHGRYFEFLGETQGFEAPKSFQKKHVKVGFDEFEYGIIKRRVLEGHTEEDDDWAIGHPLVFPYGMRVGGRGHRADADPGADRRTRPPGSCSTPSTHPRAIESRSSRIGPGLRVSRGSDEDGRVHRPTTSRARTSWPG